MTLNIETVLAGAEENGNLLAFPDEGDTALLGKRKKKRREREVVEGLSHEILSIPFPSRIPFWILPLLYPKGRISYRFKGRTHLGFRMVLGMASLSRRMG